jgi:glycosyltransferase involved in cell wall biosynthesis
VRVLVVIPAFNEEQALAPLLAEARAAFTRLGDSVEILVVDDGSRDGTPRVARAANARLLRLCRNLGIGGAVQSGLRVAAREGYDCAVQMDGDGQHPPDQLEGLLMPMRSAAAPDLVIGSRFLGEGSYRSTFVRRLGILWLRLVLRVIAGSRVTDPTSGFRVYGRRALALYDETYPYDFPEPEAIAIAHAAKLEMREAPVVMRERQGGVSSIGPLAAVYYMVKVTVAVMLAYARNRRRDVASFADVADFGRDTE